MLQCLNQLPEIGTGPLEGQHVCVVSMLSVQTSVTFVEPGCAAS